MTCCDATTASSHSRRPDPCGHQRGRGRRRVRVGTLAPMLASESSSPTTDRSPMPRASALPCGVRRSGGRQRPCGGLVARDHQVRARRSGSDGAARQPRPKPDGCRFDDATLPDRRRERPRPAGDGVAPDRRRGGRQAWRRAKTDGCCASTAYRTAPLWKAHLRNKGRHGSPAARRLLQAAEDGARSEAERILIRLLRAAGITGWKCEPPGRRLRGGRRLSEMQGGDRDRRLRLP